MKKVTKKKTKKAVKKVVKKAVKAVKKSSKKIVKKAKSPVAAKPKGTKKKIATKGVKKVDSVLMNLRVSESDKRRMTAKAKQFTKGNLSLWVRQSALKFTPEKQATR